MNENTKRNVLYSSRAVTGYATASTPVYHGPDASNYAKVGSIGPNETVNVLATLMGWYHIEYTVNGTTQRKTGYVPQSSLTNVTGGALTEEDFYGGYCYASTELDVRTCDTFENTAAVGTLYKNEGCTFLFSYRVGDKNIAFIEYATPSGTKRGYVYSDYLKFPVETIVCIANETLPVYATPNFSISAQLGTIYQNELMGVVAKEGNVIYVEYNTAKGRKRGYVDWTKVNPRDYVSGTVFSDFYKTPANAHIPATSGSVPVYGGPSTAYAKIGSVNNENVTCFWNQNSTNAPLTCIEYVVNTTGALKRGYVDPASVSVGGFALENNPLEDLTVEYPHFERKVYGKTQLGKDMVYYKTGTGPNHIFLTFALHGWEDGTYADGSFYHGDGNMLIKISKRFMQNFGNLSAEKIAQIKSKWTIFVFAGINLDGIVNGYSNNGFGRCLYSGLDPNRNWPGDFVKNDSPRYKTGREYMGNTEDFSDVIELFNLKQTISNNAGRSQNILIDVHGWYNQTVGNSKLGEFYWNSFGIPKSRHSYSYGSGYLINWVNNSINQGMTLQNEAGIGAASCLLELPPTTDYSDTNMNSYGDKFFNGTINMLENTGDSVIYPDISEGVTFNKLFNQLEALYTLASEYKPNASIKEKNILVLQFLRHINYNSFSFNFLYGKIDNDFINFVKENKHIVDLNYIMPDNIIVPDSVVTSGIKIAHLAACLNGYLYDHPNFEGEEEKDADNLGCWAGDLVQMGEVFEKKSVTLSKEEASQIIATNNVAILTKYGMTNVNECGFAYEDWTHDIDAVCLKDRAELNPIYQAFREYYVSSDGYGKRYATFIQKIIPNGSTNFNDIYNFAYSYLNPDRFVNNAFNTLFTYFGANNFAIAHGFATRLLACYNQENPAPVVPNISYQAHVQNIGWQNPVSNGGIAGTTGQDLRIEAIKISSDIDIQYRVHMEGIGWGDWVPKDCIAGTTGQNRRIEAIEIISSYNDFKGQAHVQYTGWMPEQVGTQIVLGTTGQNLRLEAFKLQFLPK